MKIKQFNPLKILNHWDALSGLFKGKNLAPVSCEIDPSNLCNHNCIWCMYRDFKNKKKMMIPREIFFNLIRELGIGGVKSITFTGGGEPLTNPATVEGLYKVRRAGMEVGLVTNGGLMTSAVSGAIVESCAFLRVSLDAATRNTHTSLHKPKDLSKDGFDRILENIRVLVDLKKKANKSLSIGIAYLVHPLNYSEIYNAAKLVKKLGVDYIQIRPAFIPGKKVPEKMRFAVQGLMEKSLKLNNSRFHVFPILHRFDELTMIERTYTCCRAHALVGVVGADCNVYLCCQLRGDARFSFGNLKENSFFEIWKGKKRQEVIKRINLDKCPPCRYNKYNELMDYLADKDKIHANFL